MATTHIILILIIAALIYYILTLRKQISTQKQKLKEAETELEEYKEKYPDEIMVIDLIRKRGFELAELETMYYDEHKAYDELVKQSKIVKSELEMYDFGVYEPYFDFDTSEIFKAKIKEVKQQQKKLISDDEAIIGGENWTVNGSTSEGRKMTKKQKKLMLRAFNGESDNFISSVKWNNVQRMEERLERSAKLINQTGESHGIEITRAYIDSKLNELRLNHEYRLKKQEEKEKQRAIREQIREEEKAKREFEKAKKETLKEEQMLQKAMKKAREQILKASEEEKQKFELQLSELQEKLKVAEEKNQRAISMAQQTKAGHVYVISNIGSFGENVYKIGMTRRLEPMDRVAELGDASVPFRFDVHAMIYSDNAPELENALHKEFDRYRVNHVNRRREYFNVSLKDIERIVKENHGDIEFVIEPEAQEYRESLAIKANIEKGVSQGSEHTANY